MFAKNSRSIDKSKVKNMLVVLSEEILRTGEVPHENGRNKKR